MEKEVENIDKSLLVSVKSLIDTARRRTSQAVNTALTVLYWQIGNRINEEVLQEERATYGDKIVERLSKRLTEEYGNRSFQVKNLRRMMQFASIYNDFEIVASLVRQLSWTHFTILLPIKNEVERDFYTQLCRVEKWSVRVLREKKRSMLFERMAISKKPEELAKLELKDLADNDTMSPDLVFKNPYILDFLDLKSVYQEKDLEQAILLQIEDFLLELGRGFAFLERQKRMIIDGKDFKLDLLFYHRKLKRLVAIDLKIGEFKPAYKGQMELYLRWLERYEMEDYDEQPIGLILCAEGNYEQVELLQLDKSNIRVAEYITEALPEKLLKEKLHQFMLASKKYLNNQ